MSEKFTYTVKGKNISLPAYTDVYTFGFARRNKHLSEVEQTFKLIEDNATEADLDVLDSMSVLETRDLVVAWVEHSGLKAGEYLSSSN